MKKNCAALACLFLMSLVCASHGMNEGKERVEILKCYTPTGFFTARENLKREYVKEQIELKEAILDIVGEDQKGKAFRLIDMIYKLDDNGKFENYMAQLLEKIRASGATIKNIEKKFDMIVKKRKLYSEFFGVVSVSYSSIPEEKLSGLWESGWPMGEKIIRPVQDDFEIKLSEFFRRLKVLQEEERDRNS